MTDPLSGYDQWELEQREKEAQAQRDDEYAEAKRLVARVWQRTDNGKRTLVRRVLCIVKDIERIERRGVEPQHEADRCLGKAEAAVGLAGIIEFLAALIEKAEA